MDVVVCDGPERKISFRSGLTVYEEAWVDGLYCVLGWNGAGYLSSVITKPVVPSLNISDFADPQAFRVEIDGQDLRSHWEYSDFEQDDGENRVHTVLTLRHGLRPVTIRVHTVVDGTPVLVRWLEVTNDGSGPAALASVSPWSGGLQTTRRWAQHLSGDESLYSLGYMANTHWGNEGEFRWYPLPDAKYTIGGRRSRDKHRHPMFVLRNNGTGEIFIGQLAWSGGYTLAFDLNADVGGVDDMAAHLSFEFGPDAPAPLRVLAPGETIASPEVHMGMVFGGLDDGVQAMHDHIRQSVFDLPLARGRTSWVEALIGPEVDMSATSVEHEIELAEKLGAEVFIIDAGWYTPPNGEAEWNVRVGDWVVNEARYPGGIDPIRDLVHQKGMLFGLWIEPERLGPASRTLAEHPEWVATDYDGGRLKGNPSMLNLGDPEVAAWALEQLRGVLINYGLDFLRWDYNVGRIGTAGCSLHDGYWENNYWRYYESFDNIMRSLRAEFPNVVFENCASGGARTDLATVRWFNHTWVTDWQIAPRSFAITNGMTMALPPEYVDRLVAGQSGHVTAELMFQLRLVLFGRPSLGQFHPVGTVMNPQQLESVRHTLDIYKEFVRPMARDSRVYHHTPDVGGPEPKDWGVLELASKDGGSGIVAVFRLSGPGSAAPEVVVKLRGADISKRYRVRFDNSGSETELSGYCLVKEGVPVRLEGALTSELLLFTAK